MRWERAVTIAAAVLAIAGTLWAVYAKPASWDQTTKDVAEMKPKVEEHGNRLTASEAHYQDIIHRLDQISAKLDE